MDANQIVVTVLGFALIAGVLVFFFGPRKKRRTGAARPTPPAAPRS